MKVWVFEHLYVSCRVEKNELQKIIILPIVNKIN